MQCPKCGFKQPSGLECLNCGLIFAKYRPEEHRQPAPQPAAPPPPPPDPFRAPIRPLLRAIRTMAGLVAVVVGAWLFLGGQELHLLPLHVVLLIGYACVGLFWLLSAVLPVTVKQFAIEMLIFVISTVLLKVALPEAFDPGRLSNTETGPLQGGEAASVSAKLDADDYARQAEELARLARDVLDAPGDPTMKETWARSAQQCRTAFRKLSRDERRKAEATYKAAVALEERIGAILEAKRAVEADAAFRAVEVLEREIMLLERPSGDK